VERVCVILSVDLSIGSISSSRSLVRIVKGQENGGYGSDI
jgi:hypothetical protein